MKFSIYSYCLILLISAIAGCNNGRSRLGKQHAEKQVRNAIIDKPGLPIGDRLINNEQTAISVIEPILFKIYGKDNIIKQRPYECYLIDDFWFVGGTIPERASGGGFEVIINSRTAEVIKLIHYK